MFTQMQLNEIPESEHQSINLRFEHIHFNLENTLIIWMNGVKIKQTYNSLKAGVQRMRIKNHIFAFFDFYPRHYLNYKLLSQYFCPNLTLYKSINDTVLLKKAVQLHYTSSLWVKRSVNVNVHGHNVCQRSNQHMLNRCHLGIASRGCLKCANTK